MPGADWRACGLSYEDAITTSGNAERIELRELTELIEEALGAADAAELAPAGTEAR